ncbi:DUF2849 domain-containing protein [Methylocystis heyeri]|uniref:DUF2849 domain-containing protein n=1 Tax=Methylocystis heyeri TaxID=391905 RepID=A0A6B8KB62_9HYPH|nr:DUF2849 domain-containing protein [Methylocystis heyeri]QGM45366.1 DUF2849 domain-containing protein [Methylocystis heyeri]
MALLKNPQILIASDLRDGEALFLGADGWARDHKSAAVARDSQEAAALEARGKGEIAANRVVDVYLADVGLEADGSPTPLHYREKMRIKGPSVRPDLGKQARAAQSGDAK